MNTREPDAGRAPGVRASLSAAILERTGRRLRRPSVIRLPNHRLGAARAGRAAALIR